MSSKAKLNEKVKSSKSEKHSSKSEKHSSKSEKHSSSNTGKKIAEAMKTVLSLVTKKPKHYTSRYLASEAKLGGKFGAEVVRAAIAGLEEKDAITFTQVKGKGKERGAYFIVPLSRKAA